MNEQDPIVTIDSGAVRGVWRSGSAAFRGIPFAKAPVGARRFAAPEPPEPWEGVRDGRMPPPTPQREEASGPTLIPEPSVSGDEILNVSVHTPSPGTDAALPVLVWIHGGGYTAGSPASPWYDGRSFNRDGVVTVVVSYRLGFDGFGAVPDAPANRAVLDWLAALEWVQRNIAAFGGDPGAVTIAGQSAGGGAVLTLLGMPQAQPLFHRVWALSAAVTDVTVERAGTFAAKLAALAGVDATREGFASIDERELVALQERAAQVGEGDQIAQTRDLIENGLPYGPLVDGELLTRPTLASIAAGVGADKPLVIGTTDDEFTMATDPMRTKLRLVPAELALRGLEPVAARRRAYLKANGPQRRKGTAAVLGRYVTDAVFRAPLVRLVRARGTAPTWVYRFVWVSPSIGWACHCLDVPFWWDVLDASDAIAYTAGPNPPQALADIVHSAACAFVRDSDPGWPAWSHAEGTTRVFGDLPTRPDVIADGYASALPLV